MLRSGFHYHSGLSKPDRAHGVLRSHVLRPYLEGGVEREHLGVGGEGGRVVRPGGRGHLPTVTVRVLATLRRFLREDRSWKGLRATDASASGSTLRRRLADWAQTGVLRHVHSMQVGMLRSQPNLARDLIVDNCSVRAKRGGDLTGPNPTDPPQCGALSAGPRRGPSITSRSAGTACRWPAWPRQPT